jgi:hypothetical protein
MQPDIATAIRTMRNDSGRERLTATTLLAYQYRRWQDSTADDAAAQMAQAEVRSAVLDDLLWIIRYATGEPELQVRHTQCALHIATICMSHYNLPMLYASSTAADFAAAACAANVVCSRASCKTQPPHPSGL